MPWFCTGTVCKEMSTQKKPLHLLRVTVSDTVKVKLSLMEKEGQAKKWKLTCSHCDDPQDDWGWLAPVEPFRVQSTPPQVAFPGSRFGCFQQLQFSLETLIFSTVCHHSHIFSHSFFSLLALHPVRPWFSEKELRATSKCCFIEKESRRASRSCHLCQTVSAHGFLRNGNMSDSGTENRETVGNE